MNSEVLFYGTYTLSIGLDSLCLCSWMQNPRALYRDSASALPLIYCDGPLLSRMRRHKGCLEFSARSLAARILLSSLCPLLRNSFRLVYAVADHRESFQREALHRHEVQKRLSLFRTFSRPCQLDCPQFLDSDFLTKPLLIALMQLSRKKTGLQTQTCFYIELL